MVQTCLKLYREKLPEFNEVGSDLAFPGAGPPQSPAPPGDTIPALDNFAHLWALPQGKKGKPKDRVRWFANGYRAWMSLGTASILGFLIALSFRIF